MVYVGSIATQHVKLGLMMLNAGKHVLCEMPLALNAKQAKILIEAAKRNNVFLMEVRVGLINNTGNNLVSNN